MSNTTMSNTQQQLEAAHREYLTITEVPQVTIDITPESLKTPEGAAKVAAALEAWQTAQAEVANQAATFVDEHGGDFLHVMQMYGPACEDFRDLQGAIDEMAERQHAFLVALAGR
jgi:hypothetical protein